MNIILISAPLFAAAAILYVALKAVSISGEDPGNERMKEISGYIAEGAKAFLFSEYRVLAFFVAALFLLLLLFIGAETAVCFLFGALFSVCAGYIGMNVAVRANTRTAAAAEKHGMNKALSIAFGGGSVMGMSVAGLGLLGCSMIFLLTGNTSILTGFSLGASSIALFARVGGGIYTKAADVGADLVGKVENNIPEDDPRNPAAIADNVGDNVGDVAGMGADLFESYVGAIVSAVTLGIGVNGLFHGAGAAFPLALSGLGIGSSLIATAFVRGKGSSDPHKALNLGSFVSAILVSVFSVFLSRICFGSLKEAVSVISGLAVGLMIGLITEYYTSGDFRSVKHIARNSTTGAATTIISGIAVGMRSTIIPIILISAGICLSYRLTGLYGIALAAVGMLSTTGITVAVDAYGPIADNAGGIAEMSGLPEEVRSVTDKLDAVGNTTAAMGKGFAIGSAALTALALFVSFSETVGISAAGINLLDYRVTVGLFIGGMLPFMFSALTMESVSKAANKMVEEVRRQFRTIPGILEGTAKPDYKACVAISTNAALKEMLLPGILAVLIPPAVGLTLGVEALGGTLSGSLVTGVLLAIFMSNAGGAWDNAKKYIEDNNFGGKGSDAHHAAVVGDTVGDPFKDTSGPSLNILIKLMTVVSLVFAPVFIKVGSLL